MAEAASDDGVPVVLINNLLDVAERLLLNQRFGLPAAQDLLTSLWTSHLRAANGGTSEAELLFVMVSTAQRIVRHYYAELEHNKREVYERNQTRLFLLCALAAFPSTLTDKGAEGLLFTFKCEQSEPRDEQQRPELFLHEVDGMFNHCNCLNVFDSHRDKKIETLLEFTSWFKRKRPAAAFFIANMIHSLYQGVKSLTYEVYGRYPLGVDMNHLIHFAGIECVFCLIRMGFMEKASDVLESLPRANWTQMTPQLKARFNYVRACLLRLEGKHVVARQAAQYAFDQSEDEEEKAEIGKLIEQLREDTDNGDNDIPQTEPDLSWLSGTNVDQIARCAERQKTVREEHTAKSKHRRPKRVQHQKQSTQPVQTSNQNVSMTKPTPEHASCKTPISPSSSQTTRLPSSHSASRDTSRDCSSRHSSGEGTLRGSATSRGSDDFESDEEEDDEEDELLESKRFSFLQNSEEGEDSMFGNCIEETVSLLPIATEDGNAENWYQHSLSSSLDGIPEDIHISEEQLQRYEKPDTRKPFYTDLIMDTKTLEDMLKANPDKYKRCRLKIISPQEAVAKVLDKGNSCSDILIDGRSKIGRTFMDDEVVVELLAAPNQHNGQGSARRPDPKSTQTSTDRQAHGQVVGILKTTNFAETTHPVLLCTVDEKDTNLMRPLCKTIPNIHVLHHKVKQKFSQSSGNYIEIYQLSADGEIIHKDFFRLDHDKLNQYVFRVVYITWRYRGSVYPLGAVLGVHLAGRDFNGGMELLAMQHRLPTVYPPDAIAQTQQLMQEGPPPTEGREDLRAKRIFTIDPPNSKDLDDAVSVWKEGCHYVVGIHITDVAAAIKPDTPVDLEARRRGVTFYPHRHKRHTMLPEPLSDGQLSLLPGKERLAISFFFKFNERWNPVGDPVIKKTIIKSCKQLTYEDAQRVIDEDPHVEVDALLCGEIRQLHKIASKLKEKRQNCSALFVSFKDPRLPDLEKNADHAPAHSLIGELMIMTNVFVARRLKSKFPNVMLVRCHPAPDARVLREWYEQEGCVSHLVIQLQGKKVSPNTQLSLETNLAGTRAGQEYLVLQREMWTTLCRHLENDEMQDARILAFMDAIHPQQCLAMNHWMEMMNPAEYKCSYGLNGPDHRHFGLDLEVYTHATSPIRRYADLHVQRLLHADLDGTALHCASEDVIRLCEGINGACHRQKAFRKGCMVLKLADNLRHQPLEFRAFVESVDKEKLALCVPSLLALSARKQEIPFSTLGVSSLPEVTTDTALKRDSVSVQWCKRIYDEKGTCPGSLIPIWKHLEKTSRTKSSFSPFVMQISRDQLSVLVKQKDWIKILKTLASDGEISVTRTPEPVPQNKQGVEYMSSEKGDGTVTLRPVRYETVYTPGQVLQIQMSAESYKGILTPRVELLRLARNASICMEHTKNPVHTLTRPATRATRDQQFNDHEEYIRAWMPLLEMEAAVGAGDTDGAVVIDNVTVTMKTQTEGSFRLDAKFCSDRCISIGGKSPDSIREEETKTKNLFPLDYLCLRCRVECPATLVSRARQSVVSEVVDNHFTWLAHAAVKAVVHRGRKEDDGGQLVVTFHLSHSSPEPPLQLTKKDGARMTVEILPKSEVERRAQEMLSQLQYEGCELARAIAYEDDIPQLDKDHLEMGQKKEYHEVSNRSEETKKLPWNNERQREAIEKALTSRLSLIQGPPGTGKTYTSVKLVYLFTQINRKLAARGKGMRTVLFCGPSNKAVDLVAKLLKSRLGAECPKIVRVYSAAIETNDYPVPRGDLRSRRGMHDLNSDKELTDVCLHHLIREEDRPYAGEIAKCEKEFALSRQNPDTFPVTSKLLKYYRKLLFKASVEELKHYEVVLTTCAMAGNQRLIQGIRGRVFQVMIDECGMSPEPHSMIPIVASHAQQVVLIGDHKQLRPVITCNPAAELGLNQSLFERLFIRFPGHTVFLNKQYRMHPQICMFPSSEFYHDRLYSGLSQSWTEELLPFWPENTEYHLATTKVLQHPANQLLPHVFVDVRGVEETLTVATDEGNERSKSNALEADKVIEILTYLKEQHKVPMGFVRLLTQYNAQRHVLEDRLKKLCENRNQTVFDRYDKNNINVSTVVSSQGGEWDYVILSTVRSLPSYKIEPNPTYGWRRQNLGFITDCNQVNVALTRARRGLFIIGNMELLKCDKVWSNLIDRYTTLGCVFDATQFPPPPAPRRRRQPPA